MRFESAQDVVTGGWTVDGQPGCKILLKRSGAAARLGRHAVFSAGKE